MTIITFDTLHLVDKLKSAGIPQKQAEAVIRVIAEAQDQLVTKDDLKSALDDVINPIKIDLAILKTDSLAIRWMMGILIAGVMFIVIKTFFS
ncbi:MAG: DUF1640 domain-containing protein [Methylococcales bacterium]|nr:MAG: DUF1640 domain-containing protein [Methylococcales bacterium]